MCYRESEDVYHLFLYVCRLCVLVCETYRHKKKNIRPTYPNFFFYVTPIKQFPFLGLIIKCYNFCWDWERIVMAGKVTHRFSAFIYFYQPTANLLNYMSDLKWSTLTPQWGMKIKLVILFFSGVCLWAIEANMIVSWLSLKYQQTIDQAISTQPQ